MINRTVFTYKNGAMKNLWWLLMIISLYPFIITMWWIIHYLCDKTSNIEIWVQSINELFSKILRWPVYRFSNDENLTLGSRAANKITPQPFYWSKLQKWFSLSIRKANGVLHGCGIRFSLFSAPLQPCNYSLVSTWAVTTLLFTECKMKWIMEVFCMLKESRSLLKLLSLPSYWFSAFFDNHYFS